MLIKVSAESAEDRRMAIYQIGTGDEKLAIDACLQDAKSKIAERGKEWVYYEKDDLWLLIDREEWETYEDPLGAARDHGCVLLLSAKVVQPGVFWDVDLD